MNKIALTVLSACIALASGCGDSASGSVSDAGADAGNSPDEIAKFLGSWRYTAGEIKVLCGTGSSLNIPPLNLVGQGFDIVKGGGGAGGDLLRIQVGCGMKMNVKGTEANIVSAQTCSASVPLPAMNGMPAMMVPVMLTMNDYKITLKPNDTATTDGSGSGMATFSGLTLTCGVTETGTLVKSGADGGTSPDSSTGG